ncbi:hypothetical protein L249_5703 [Ophiocordyceps polyrhachis-furcata BCC 54312]|uniref:Uncharacterized protein n=1 Tax=Ophiocordyceps polyrhachis-furcata BCC 54312 TaxID=1330021 RepID=A0A367L000_9HYPO|nr:hypothetical protein L249_5703 [Ophiocordyceps polyrhachis-furcata BCC 54312]
MYELGDLCVVLCAGDAIQQEGVRSDSLGFRKLICQLSATCLLLSALACLHTVSAFPAGNIGFNAAKQTPLGMYIKLIEEEGQVYKAKGWSGTGNEAFPNLMHCLTDLPLKPMLAASIDRPAFLKHVLGGEKQYHEFLTKFLRKDKAVRLTLMSRIEAPVSPVCVPGSTPLGPMEHMDRSPGWEPPEEAYQVVSAWDFLTRKEYSNIGY